MTELFAESESRFFLKIRPYDFVFTKAEGQTPFLEIVEGRIPSSRRGSSERFFLALAQPDPSGRQPTR